MWTALGELHAVLKPYMHAQLTMSFDANDDVGILIESRYAQEKKKKLVLLAGRKGRESFHGLNERKNGADQKGKRMAN